MGQHRAPRTRTPPLIVSGCACSVAAIIMFHGIPASFWWGLGGWALAVLGVAMSIGAAGYAVWDDPEDTR